MTSLILMYVYFDKHCDIKAITPNEDLALSAENSHTLMPISEVEPFLLGKCNPFDYTIKKVKKIGGETYTISKKFSAVNLTRSLDNYVTKVSETGDNPIIRIVVNPNLHTISLVLNEGFKDLYTSGSVEEQESVVDFLESGLSTIYITRKNNPYSLLYNLTFQPTELFNNTRMNFEYDESLDLRNSSAYTKRLVNSYRYMIKEVRNGI